MSDNENDTEVIRIEECEPYRGEQAIPGIDFRAVGSALGITAWGMNAIEIEPGCDGYPEHDHEEDGQEEAYLVLRGGGTLITPGGEQSVETGSLVRVGPGVRRKFVPGGDGLALLAIGGTPGRAYVPRG